MKSAMRPTAPRINGVLSRRSILGAALGFGMASLASAALASRALAKTGKSAAEELARRAHEPSIALAEGKITQVAWQDAMAAVKRVVGPDADTIASQIEELL